MKCHEARQLLIHYSNGEIGRSERELLQAHLTQCESCFRHLQSLSNVEQQVRAGLHEAADLAEPSSMAWQELSHRLAGRRRERTAPHSSLPLIWRLMGGVSATIALAAVVGAVIVTPSLRPAHTPLDSPSTQITTQAHAPADATTGLESASSVDATQMIAPAPRKKTRPLLLSEPDSFLQASQVRIEPESEFVSQISCYYCLRMR